MITRMMISSVILYHHHYDGNYNLRRFARWVAGAWSSSPPRFDLSLLTKADVCLSPYLSSSMPLIFPRSVLILLSCCLALAFIALACLNQRVQASTFLQPCRSKPPTLWYTTSLRTCTFFLSAPSSSSLAALPSSSLSSVSARPPKYSGYSSE